MSLHDTAAKNSSEAHRCNVPDLILRVFASPFLVVPLFLLVASVAVLIAAGFLELSWGEGGLKIAQGQRSSESLFAG